MTYYHVYTTSGDVWVIAESPEEAETKAILLTANHGIPAVITVIEEA